MTDGIENLIDNQLKQWIIEAFHLTEKTIIKIAEHATSTAEQATSQTVITINQNNDEPYRYTIKKPKAGIAEKDIHKLRRFIKFEKLKQVPIIGNLFRFLGLWIAFTGVYTIFAVCPFCGQMGCPVGAGSAGVIGGFFALIVQNMKNVLNFVQHKLTGSSK
jgi:hypothetical protein